MNKALKLTGLTTVTTVIDASTIPGVFPTSISTLLRSKTYSQIYPASVAPVTQEPGNEFSVDVVPKEHYRGNSQIASFLPLANRSFKNQPYCKQQHRKQMRSGNPMQGGNCSPPGDQKKKPEGGCQSFLRHQSRSWRKLLQSKEQKGLLSRAHQK